MHLSFSNFALERRGTPTESIGVADPIDTDNTSDDIYSRPGFHRFIGVTIASVLAFVVFLLWIILAKWPRQKMRMMMQCCRRSTDPESALDSTGRKKPQLRGEQVQMQEGFRVGDQGHRMKESREQRGASNLHSERDFKRKLSLDSDKDL